MIFIASRRRLCTLLHVRMSYHSLSSSSSSSSLREMVITTPAFYVNANPHIGHIYSAIIADSLARWKRLLGHPVQLVSGSDEHGNKVRDAAMMEGKTPIEHCDIISARFEKAMSRANCNIDKIIRTTSAKHRFTVNFLWDQLLGRDYIYKDDHSGWYCRSDETFVPDGQIEDLPNGEKVLRDTQKTLEFVSESNYKFRLSAFRDRIREHILENPFWLQPQTIREEILTLLSEETDKSHDVSISRSIISTPWAWEVPYDMSQSIYVWFDALASYLTACDVGYASRETQIWPPECQIIGKDIARFHAILWPAILMAVGLELPRTIFAHSHWTIGGVKMSKSIGNVIHPEQLMKQLGGADPMRYYMLRIGGSLSQDGDVDVKLARECVNSALSNHIGNLISRVTKLLSTTFVREYFDVPEQAAKIQEMSDDRLLTTDDRLALEMIEHHRTLGDDVKSAFENLRFDFGLMAIDSYMASANRYFSAREAWALIKHDESDRNLAIGISAIVRVLNAIQKAAILLQPVIPVMARKVLTHFKTHLDERLFVHAADTKARINTAAAFTLSQRRLVLFPRLEYAVNTERASVNVTSSEAAQTHQ